MEDNGSVQGNLSESSVSYGVFREQRLKWYFNQAHITAYDSLDGPNSLKIQSFFLWVELNQIPIPYKQERPER